LKLLFLNVSKARVGSRPARGAWIETFEMPIIVSFLLVAPREGRVD